MCLEKPSVKPHVHKSSGQCVCVLISVQRGVVFSPVFFLRLGDRTHPNYAVNYSYLLFAQLFIIFIANCCDCRTEEREIRWLPVSDLTWPDLWVQQRMTLYFNPFLTTPKYFGWWVVSKIRYYLRLIFVWVEKYYNAW